MPTLDSKAGIVTPGPCLTTVPTPSWPPTWPFCVGNGRAGHACMHTPKSEWHTPECVLFTTFSQGFHLSSDSTIRMLHSHAYQNLAGPRLWDLG